MASATYRRRAPEESAVRELVRAHLETFLARAQARDPEGRGVPRYVSQALRRFVDCGVLGKGFARVRCPDCRHEMLVGFS